MRGVNSKRKQTPKRKMVCKAPINNVDIRSKNIK